MAATQIPTNVLVPLFYAQMDASGNASTSTWNPTLLLGQGLAGGTGVVDTLYPVSTAAEVAELFGAGSMLHRQAIAYFAADPYGETYVYCVADPNPGTAAQGKLTITGPATADGILHLAIGGQALDISVSEDDTADDIGAAIAAALPVHGSGPNDYPVSAGNAAGVVTLTAKHKGYDAGNFIKIEVNPLGAKGRQVLPSGVACAITKAMGELTPGAGVPDLSDFAGNIATFDTDMLVLGFSDYAETLAGVSAEFGDTAGRWSYVRQQYGHVVGCYEGTSSEETTFSAEVDDQHITIVGIEGDDTGTDPKVANPPYEVAAHFAGLCFASLRNDPGQPCQTLAFTNSLDGKVKWRGPDLEDRWSFAVRNSLLADGIATVNYDRSGKIRIEREVTTSKTVGGAPSTAYRDMQVLFISMKWLRELRSTIETLFGRAKLNDLTLSAIKAAVVAKYAEMEALELVQDTDGFAESLVVQVNEEDPNRVDILAAPKYVGQLRVCAVNSRFSL